MVQDLVHNLCESLVENIDGVAGMGETPTPITYLTQWKIVGNSEVHGNEIWSCGEYNATDGKYHILVQPQGGSIADIALDAPLRKIENISDTIEFPSGTEGKALVTRNIASILLGDISFRYNANSDRLCFDAPYSSNRSFANIALNMSNQDAYKSYFSEDTIKSLQTIISLNSYYNTVLPNINLYSMFGIDAETGEKLRWALVKKE